MRTTGAYQTTTFGDESVRAFVPYPLPPRNPQRGVEGQVARWLAEANAAVGKLSVAAAMVPCADWFLYGFVRKEAVTTSQIEGTQATLQDVVEFEATPKVERLADVQEVCNYVDALNYARREIGRPKGLPLSTRLLCAAHKRLMRGIRGADKLPGEIRSSQNWVGGTRPGNARFVPPPPADAKAALAALDQWIHSDDPLPALIKAGLAHVQFETIHPFLDGNGRIGRLLIALLVEHWKVLSLPILYVSVPLMRRRDEYYRWLTAVRTDGDWEGWSQFFLECVCEAADDGVAGAKRIFALLAEDRQTVLSHDGATVSSMRLFELLPSHPALTLGRAMQLLETTKPTASKALDALQQAGVLREITGKQRDRVYVYERYVAALSSGM
ncbi:MAG TPA: Fic family protein [Lacipirellulaceae bacterium]|nr:Fic family protein [Lacipirellulaceae bacterium]